MYVTSKQASKELGLHPNTLRDYADNGTIESYRTKSGQRRYNVEAYLGLGLSGRGHQQQSTTICYCRVSSTKQRDDLGRQIQFMREQYPGAEIVKDIFRSLNYKRRGLKALLERAMRGEQHGRVWHARRLQRWLEMHQRPRWLRHLCAVGVSALIS